MVHLFFLIFHYSHTKNHITVHRSIFPYLKFMSNLSMKFGSCTNMFINETSALNSNQTKKIVHGFDIEYHPALIMIAVLVIISNMFVIVLFVTKETLRKGGKLLLLSLAISDVMTGLVIIPLNIGCEVTYSLRLCISSGILNRFLAISTVYHILAITFETYYAILRPMEHRVKVERQKVLCIALGIWFGALLVAVTPLTWTIGVLTDVEQQPTKGFKHKMSVYEFFVISSGFLLPLTLMIFAHARMFSKIINALKLMRRQNSSAHRLCNMNKNKYKAAILFAALLLIFTVCWLFWFVTSLLNAVSKGHVYNTIPKWAVDTLTIVRYSTSFINPLLYTFFRPDFYTAFKTLFRGSNRRTPSITLTYLLSGSHRTKRDSQTTSTLVREHSTAPTMCVNAQQQSALSKLIEKDTKV